MSSIVLDLEQIRTDTWGLAMVCLETIMLAEAHDGIGAFPDTQTLDSLSEKMHVPRSAVVQIHGMVGTVTRFCREVISFADASPKAHCQP